MPNPAPDKSIEERLRACERRYTAIVQHTPNVTIQGYSPDGRVLFWNEASEHVFGWLAEEAIGKRLEQLIFTKEEGALFLGTLQKIRDTNNRLGPLEFRFTRRNAEEGWCRATD